MKTAFIYFLKDPENPNKGYVGKSNNPRIRLPQHLSECKTKKHYRANWLKSLIARKLKPVLEIIDEVPFEHWKQCEVAYIEFFLERGFELTNGTPGGDDPPSTAGKKFSLGHCAKISAALTGKKQSAAHRAKNGASHVGLCAGEKHYLFGKKLPAETCVKIRVTLTGTKRSPESIAKAAAKNTGKKRTPAQRSATSAALIGKKPKTNTSGFVGVQQSSRNLNWEASFRLDGRTTHIGTFKKIEDAVFARALAVALQ